MKTYNFQNDIKMIRKCLGMTQIDFAESLEISRSNIARYEAGAISPRKEAAEKIYNFAFLNDFDLNGSKAMLYEDEKKGKILLFHGARGEIVGEIDTKHSEPPNDFGDGFYLGQTLRQANMWVSAHKGSSTYCFYFNDNGLRKIEFDVDYDWMLAILYFRGALNGYILPDRLSKILEEIALCDYIIAPIADNQMYDTLELFKNNIISDVACLHALSANNLGKQYVMKSEKACSRLESIDRLYLCNAERNFYLDIKERSFNEGKNKTSLAIAKYRKEGELFNEIFKRKK